MKLEPVFLVAPSPEPPPPAPTRRSFILALGGGLLAAGFALGRWSGAAASPAAGQRVQPELTELDRWAIALAQTGSEADVAAQFESFLLVFHTRPPLREQLRPGVEKLVSTALDDETLPRLNRQMLADALIQALRELPQGDSSRAAMPRLERLLR